MGEPGIVGERGLGLPARLVQAAALLVDRGRVGGQGHGGFELAHPRRLVGEEAEGAGRRQVAVAQQGGTGLDGLQPRNGEQAKTENAGEDDGKTCDHLCLDAEVAQALHARSPVRGWIQAA